jgi:glutaredoxin/glutathione-dependent peroxiredoxin
MSIEPGQKIPSVTIKRATPNGGEEVDPAKLFAGKKVIMFSLPGAFTPTCSQKHLPGYLAKYDELKGKGIDLIACLSVNDAWVMQAWGDQYQVGDKIVLLADGAGEFSKALGIDFTPPHMGVRARRGVVTIEDATVKSIELEAPGKFEVSSAECVLQKL